jgi:hypothetical protein
MAREFGLLENKLVLINTNKKQEITVIWSGLVSANI